MSCRTKVIVTLGPATRDVETVRKLAEAGASVFRINTAHGNEAQWKAAQAAVREVEARIGRPLGVLVDLAGPKIRLWPLPGGGRTLAGGEEVRLWRRRRAGAGGELGITRPAILTQVRRGDRVLLADGAVELEVTSVGRDAVVCRVLRGGTVRSGQGVHFPGMPLAVRVPTAADQRHAGWAAREGADFVGLSFVRSAREVHSLRRLLARAGSQAWIVAKIERPEAVERLDEIVAAADALMVARGDLGVETDPAEVPVLQKRIIDSARRAARPVITATQMLDSMQTRPQPTRAEASDVANAVLDGSDACLLSGETAVGRYPVEAVRALVRIAASAERILPERLSPLRGSVTPGRVHPVTEAMASAAARVAEDVGAALVVIRTRSGATAVAFSRHRSRALAVGVGATATASRRMVLPWGVFPLAAGSAEEEVPDLVEVERRAVHAGILRPGERLVVLDGTGVPGAGHNRLLVCTAGRA